MTKKEIILKIYEGGLKNLELLNDFLDEKVTLTWFNSENVKEFDKSEILNFSKEIKDNYHTSLIEIKEIISENDKVVLYYTHYVSTIENVEEIVPIANMMVIWEFKLDKIIKGIQISQPIREKNT